MKHRIDFATAELKTAPHNRGRTIERDGKRFRLAEFDAGFTEDGWCEKGHAGYVVEGVLELESETARETLRAGDALSIPAGVRHRAHVAVGTVRLFLVEDL